MYELKSKDGETIFKRHARGMDEAISIFAKIKNLDKESLLMIYKVVYSG